MPNLPIGWTVQRLGDAGGLFARRVDGYSGTRPYLATSDVNQGTATPYGEFTYSGRPARADLLLKVNDVLQAKMKGTDKAFLVGETQSGWLASTGFAQFNPQAAGNSSRFFLHVLSSRWFLEAKDARCVGSTQQAISDNELADIGIAVPPRIEQAVIADVLDALHGTIQETQAIIAKLRAVKQGLLHDLLTRGIDANGELRPSQAEAPHLFKQSPRGWIPKEWNMSGLAGVGPKDRSVIRTGPFGSSLKGEHWRESGRPVVTIGSLGETAFITSELLYVGEFTASRLSDFELIPGDVVFSRVADVGRSVVVSETERGWIMSSNFMRISCDLAKARPHFLQLLLSSSVLLRTQLRTTVNSAGRDVANSAVLMGLSFPWPSPREQDDVLRRVHAIDQRLIQEQSALRKLFDGKAGLMDDLLTGRVRVTALLAEAEREKGSA